MKATRHALMVLGVFVAAAASGGGAQAQNYPWCEYIGGDMGGRNCGFVSFEQCMATARGNGGDCRQNTMYTPPPGPHHQTGYAPPPRYQHARRKAHPNS